MLRKIEFGTCPVNSFYRCERKECWDGRIKPEGCAADNLAAMEEKYRSALLRDAPRKKYAVHSVEAHVYLLNKFDRFAYHEQGNFSTTSFHEYVRANAKNKSASLVKPLPVPSVIKPAEIDDLSIVRGSGFVHSDCDMQRLISNAYHDEDEFSITGTAMHKLINQQHVDDYVHNELLAELGLDPIPRNEYCEKEIFCYLEGVPFLGHPDAVLDVGGFALGILDFKRAGTPMRGYKKQMLSYALAINQEHFNNSYNRYFLINVLHSRPQEPVTYSNPSYYIIMAEKNGPMERELRKEIVATHEEQQRLRNNFSYFESYKSGKERKETPASKSICDNCYPSIKKRCDELRWMGKTVDEHLALLEKAE